MLTWLWKLASPKPTGQVRGKRPREELVLLLWVGRKPGAESFRSSTISYWQEWLHNSWGPGQMKMWGPLLKKIKNFKMAAIEHYTRHKALKCGDIYSSRYGTPLPGPFAWNLPIDIKISFSNFLQLYKCVRCFLPGPWCLQSEWNQMLGLECQKLNDSRICPFNIFDVFTFRRVYRLWNILKRLQTLIHVAWKHSHEERRVYTYWFLQKMNIYFYLSVI